MAAKAIDMGDLYPSAEVIGTDLSPIQSQWFGPSRFGKLARAYILTRDFVGLHRTLNSRLTTPRSHGLFQKITLI